MNESNRESEWKWQLFDSFRAHRSHWIERPDSPMCISNIRTVQTKSFIECGLSIESERWAQNEIVAGNIKNNLEFLVNTNDNWIEKKKLNGIN